MTERNLTDLRYSPEEIDRKTETIYSTILTETEIFNHANFEAFATRDLMRMFELYDRYFFDNYFYNHYRDKIFFRLSQRMTRAAGKTVFNSNTNTYAIVLSITLIFQTFHDVDREVVVNGISCRDRLQAAMRIVEHEIIHLLERVLYGDSSCSGSRFKTLAYNIFGHTGVTHRLVTQTERAWKRYNLRVGDKVFFEFDGKTCNGIINRITKRATVIVRNSKGQYIDRQGNRYTKFYIPLQNLKRE